MERLTDTKLIEMHPLEASTSLKYLFKRIITLKSGYIKYVKINYNIFLRKIIEDKLLLI